VPKMVEDGDDLVHGFAGAGGGMTGARGGAGEGDVDSLLAAVEEGVGGFPRGQLAMLLRW